MKCEACGHDNVDEAAVCKKCGEELDFGTSDDLRALSPSLTARSPKEEPTRIRRKDLETLRAPAEEATENLLRKSTPTPGGFSSQSGSSGSVSSLSGTSRSGSTGDLAISSVFAGRYEIVELLGEGGMGLVYKAKDRELDGKFIALKIIRGEKGSDREVVHRFKQELVLARKITHKNVVRIYDLGEAEGIKFFTMEFIDGASLKWFIRQRGKIPVKDALAFLKQILSALQEAHEQGVIHRDLKPQNIMIDKSGIPHIMDFGIARSSDGTGMTATGVMIGTPDYMSPEQVRGEKADARSDLFSIGVILYEMVTGELPFQAETPLSKVMMRLSHKPRAPRQVTVEIPGYLENVILRCMEIDSAYRYQSAAEILRDLDREQADRSIALTAKRAVARGKKFLAAAAVVLVAVAGFVYFRGRETPVALNNPAGPITTVAILPFTNATGAEEFEWMRTGVPEMLVTDISQSQYVRPVPSERVLKVLKELGIAENTRFDEPALKSISERAPAEVVIYGQYVEAEGKLRLDLSLRKAGSGLAIPLKPIAGSASGVFALIDEITTRVKEQLDLAPDQLKGDTDRPVAEVSTSSLEALRAYQSGLDQLRQGANQAAFPLLKQATESDSNFAMAYAKLAEAYFNSGELREAETAVNRARELAEREISSLPLAERYQIHATVALINHDYETSVKSYTELAKLYPDDPDILFSLGRAQEELGKLPEALETYGRVVQIAPQHGQAQTRYAWVHVMSGRFEEAIRMLEATLSRGDFKNDPEALGNVHVALGVAYRDSSNPVKAVEQFQTALELQEKAGDRRGQAATLSNLANVHDLQGHFDQGLEAQKKALALAKEMGDREGQSNYYLEIGINRLGAGELDAAAESIKSSLAIERDRNDLTNMANRLNHLGEIYRLKGSYDEALAFLGEAKGYLDQSGDQFERAHNLHNTAMVKKAQGRYDDALEAFQGALPILKEAGYQHGVSTIQHNVAEMYMHQGEYGNAFRSLQASIELNAEMQLEHSAGDTKVPLGQLYLRLGQLDQAEKEFAEAGEATHSHGGEAESPDLLFGRGELAFLRGRTEEASEAYRQANVQANLSGRKEVAVESRIKLGRLYLQQRQIQNAENLLSRTRREAQESRLRPLEAEAAAALADLYLEKGDAEAARKQAAEAVDIAKVFNGRPTLLQAYSSLARAHERFGRHSEAVEARVAAARQLESIRASLLPEHVESFMSQPAIQSFLQETVTALDQAGRSEEAEALKKWLRSAKATASTS